MSNLSTDPISPLAIAAGGEPITLTYLNGNTESLTVPLFVNPEADYPAFLGCLGDNNLLAEFAAKRNAGWAATLHPASLMDLVERVMALNFPLVRRWAELRTRHLELLESMRGVLPAASR